MSKKLKTNSGAKETQSASSPGSSSSDPTVGMARRVLRAAVHTTHDFFLFQTWEIPEWCEKRLIECVPEALRDKTKTKIVDVLFAIGENRDNYTSADCLLLIRALTDVKRVYHRKEAKYCLAPRVHELCEIIDYIEEVHEDCREHFANIQAWLLLYLSPEIDTSSLMDEAATTLSGKISPKVVSAFMKQHAEALNYYRHNIVEDFKRLADPFTSDTSFCTRHGSDKAPLFLHKGNAYCVRCCWEVARENESALDTLLLFPELHKKVWDGVSPLDVLQKTFDSKHMRRIAEADITCPITLLYENSDAGPVIVDGYHRICRAYQTDLEMLPCIFLTSSDLWRVASLPITHHIFDNKFK